MKIREHVLPIRGRRKPLMIVALVGTLMSSVASAQAVQAVLVTDSLGQTVAQGFHYPMESSPIGVSISEVWSIENIGDEALDFSAMSALSLGGAHTDQYLVGPLSDTILEPGEVATIAITFNPTSLGTKYMTFTLSTPTLWGVFSNTIEAEAVDPVYALEVSDAEGVIPNGFHYLLPDTPAGSSSSVELELTNIGNAPLTLTNAASILVGGLDVSQYAVILLDEGSLPPASSATLLITFTPTSEGIKYMTLSLSSPESFGLFSNTLEGQAIPPQPEPIDAPEEIEEPVEEDEVIDEEQMDEEMIEEDAQDEEAIIDEFEEEEPVDEEPVIEEVIEDEEQVEEPQEPEIVEPENPETPVLEGSGINSASGVCGSGVGSAMLMSMLLVGLVRRPRLK
ncbi:MAG: hypothetical protein HJJLKODD_01259 [Phycisphaerae bacterium]|nr:hypothetical protein [Phycisphaerae bacterium]